MSRLAKLMACAAGIVMMASVIFYSSGCKKVVAKTAAAPQPEVGTAWVGLPDTGYVSFALKLNIKLSAIFEYDGTQTTDISNWITFFKLAQQRGAKLRICPIPVSASPYMDDRHAAAQLAIVTNFITLIQDNGVKPCEIILDIEGMDAAKYCAALVQYGLGVVSYRDTLVANALPVASWDSSVAIYQAFVTQMHASGWKVGATTLNQIAIENTNGDRNIERVLGIPITGISWDYITYQAYRTSTYSVFASIGLSQPTSAFVYRFAQLAQAHYGTHGGVDIGIMGVSSANGCYNTLAEWYADVDATRAAGVNPDLVVGFRMESADGNNPMPGDSAFWFNQLENSPIPAPPADDQSTDLYIRVYDSADVKLTPYLPQ